MLHFTWKSSEKKDHISNTGRLLALGDAGLAPSGALGGIDLLAAEPRLVVVMKACRADSCHGVEEVQAMDF